jgi:hypothetical protein
MVPEVYTRQSRDFVSNFPDPTLNHVIHYRPIKTQELCITQARRFYS